MLSRVAVRRAMRSSVDAAANDSACVKLNCCQELPFGELCVVPLMLLRMMVHALN